MLADKYGRMVLRSSTLVVFLIGGSLRCGVKRDLEGVGRGMRNVGENGAHLQLLFGTGDGLECDRLGA